MSDAPALLLTAPQLALLQRSTYLPAELRVAVSTALRATPASTRAYLEFRDADLAERLRDVLADRLTHAGFDEHYELNDEGLVLDELIAELSAYVD